jgi:hypothetical protein
MKADDLTGFVSVMTEMMMDKQVTSDSSVCRKPMRGTGGSSPLSCAGVCPAGWVELSLFSPCRASQSEQKEANPAADSLFFAVIDVI